ncbi:MAG TPA: tryptophan synthase subunit alpha [Fibrobacteria bacterium]|nr:tryptophan synthase subunit alpha [Fibrobacteria bacterium]
MTPRLEHRLRSLRSEGRSGLAAYLVAGDPDPATTLGAMRTMVDAGVSLLEIGVPFSDPVADGPVVADAHQRALRGGATTAGVMDLVAEFRRSDSRTPVLLMGYANPILSPGVDVFFEAAAKCGADGVIVVDAPLEHADPFRSAAGRQGISLVPLLAPTAHEEREGRILTSSGGLVYLVARTGITGKAGVDLALVVERARRARRFPGVAVVAGFGIRDAGQVSVLAGEVDLVVVGSRFVEILASSGGESTASLEREVRSMVDALGGPPRDPVE